VIASPASAWEVFGQANPITDLVDIVRWGICSLTKALDDEATSDWPIEDPEDTYHRCYKEAEAIFEYCLEQGGLRSDCESEQIERFNDCIRRPIVDPDPYIGPGRGN
jgi:hypothetical protein